MAFQLAQEDNKSKRSIPTQLAQEDNKPNHSISTGSGG
jgi:hypothetical protein